ncbi:DUF4405 domain-containing protein [Calditrichota bacterium GD2]
MAAYRRGKFSWRAFVSLYITWSALILLVSGVILYIAPAGRIAKWTHISLLGLEKEEWQAIHTIFSFLFVIAAGFHLFYNWKPFISYLKDKFKQAFALRKELYATTILTIAIFVLTLWNVPPFSTIMDIGEYFTESWESKQNEPPIPHAEELTIEELAKTVQLPLQQIIQNLKEQNIEAAPEMIVKDVAEKYDLTPSELFKKMKVEPVQNQQGGASLSGRGYGRMTLADICKDLNIPLETALERLERFHIRADGQMMLRDLANEYDKKPIDLLNIIQKGQLE